MENLFTRSKFEDAEQRRIFLSHLRPEIKKLCVMRDYANMEALLNVVLEVERVLTKIGETPFEMLKEEQKENMTIGDTIVEK
jgi:hypothetical protein